MATTDLQCKLDVETTSENGLPTAGLWVCLLITQQMVFPPQPAMH